MQAASIQGSNWLSIAKLRFIAVAAIVVSAILLIGSFATSQNNRTANGLGLGSDYMAFYNAGTILNRYGADRLYDLDLQAQLYHETLPGESSNVTLPYANAPFFAVLMRPLALLPYTWSYAAWTIISIALFAGAIAIIWQHTGLPRKWLGIALLIAISFEPFIIECLHGGQISAFGLFAICCAIHFSLTSRPFRAGLCLALCTYKPTLLPFILPMLLLNRQWRTLVGFSAGAIALAASCPNSFVDYVEILTGYANKTATGAGGFQMHKFVDLNSFMKLLGVPSAMIAMMLVGAAVTVVTIAKTRSGKLSSSWALALTCTLVLNLYVGVYDTILLVPAVLLSFKSLPRHLLMALWVLPWVCGLIARETGVQLFTIAMLALVVCQLRERAKASMTDKSSDDARFDPTSHEDAAPATGAHPALA